MTIADVLLVAWVAMMAAQGFFRGLAAQMLSIVGVAIGAFLGSWLAPHVVPGDSTLASLIGALAGAVLLGVAAGSLVGSARRFVLIRPALRFVDNWGGALSGLSSASGSRGSRPSSSCTSRVWAAPRHSAVRDPAAPAARGAARQRPERARPHRRSSRCSPASRRSSRADPSVLESPGARAAAASVVKVQGRHAGSARRDPAGVVERTLVATNAHVIAGRDTQVLSPSGQTPSRALCTETSPTMSRSCA